MSSANSRSGRIRRREEEEGAAQQTADTAAAQPGPNEQTVGTAADSTPADLSAVAAQPQPSLSVQPLPEQMRKRPRRSPRFSSPLDSLAMVELQLVMQWLDVCSKLIAARCSRRLLEAASAAFAWRAAPPVTVEAQSPADVHRIGTSLLRLAPIHLRCVGMKSLRCVSAVPHLFGLELLRVPGRVVAAHLPGLLHHPNLARLQTLRLDDETSKLLTVDTMWLIARLQKLRAFFVPYSTAGAALLRPIAVAPALTDLAIDFNGMAPNEATLNAISACPGLHRLNLRGLAIPSGLFIGLYSSPNMRQLQHLELFGFAHSGVWVYAGHPSIAADYQTSFSALEQLQSLALENVVGVDVLLSRLHLAPALRLLSIRCYRSYYGFGDPYCTLPSRDVLRALLTAAPQLEVRLLVPASLEFWMADHKIGGRALSEWQWHELHRMDTRITVVDWEPSDA